MAASSTTMVAAAVAVAAVGLVSGRTMVPQLESSSKRCDADGRVDDDYTRECLGVFFSNAQASRGCGW